MNSAIKYYTKKYWKQFIQKMRFFWIPWVLLLFMLGGACILKGMAMRIVLYVLMGIFAAVLIAKPMNVIYGLIGTRGNISLFFIYFIIINFFFSGIYYFAYYSHAGITYEINQPHVEFFTNTIETTSQQCEEFLPSTSMDTVHTYYKTTYPWVLRNTFLTSLMQEPSDFFSACSTFTGTEQSQKDPNYAMARSFHWFLIFHILVSWILLGVFISLIYQKFRNS